MKPESQPDGPHDSVRIAAETLRSRRHAEMLFEALSAQLGDAAWLETANDGALRRLFRRDPVDPTQIVPWPVLELNVGSRIGYVTEWTTMDGEPAMAPAPQPAPPPRLRGLGPGEIRLLDGSERIEIYYGDTGSKLETCRSHHRRPLPGLGAALTATDGNPIELLARYLATLDPGRHGEGRVLIPTPMPGGAGDVWQIGLRALRRARFEDAAARGGGWAVADGLTGTALGFGDTRERALAQWRAAVATRLPWPEPRPEPEPPAELPPGSILLRGPNSDVPMPEPAPEKVPCVIVPLAPFPEDPPGFGSWTPLLGEYGATSFAACRRKRRGFTLVGRDVLAAVDFERLEATLDRLDEVDEERFRAIIAQTPGGVRRYPCRTRIHHVRDDGELVLDSASENPDWHAGALDGDVIARRVVRQRWVD
jgi:hypothetical protein